MDIAKRVELSIEGGRNRNWDQALDLICPALEATARKALGKAKITGKEYKDYVRSKYQIIEPFSCTGLNMSETRFPNISVSTDDGKTLENPDVADIIYHCYRNATQHGYTISSKFAFSEQQPGSFVGWNFNFGEGRIHFPVNLVWALIATVVLEKSNKDIVSFTGQFLYLNVENKNVHFPVGLFWGGEDLVVNFFGKHPRPTVTMRFTNNIS
ncbi:hypothetical protein [Lutimaribacter saemankumensis]|nr:hypothetical protein [Lutimaribacter saemankumensis]